VFLSKLSISQGNNVLDAPASNTDGLVWRDTCVSSTQMNRPMWKKQSLSPPEKPMSLKLFLSKINPILMRKQCARFSYF
jgi:hypothetical protein